MHTRNMKNSCSAEPDRKPDARQVRLKLATQYATLADDVPTRAQFRAWVEAALLRDAEVALRVVDRPEGYALNRDFRGGDHATNVLTFIYDDTHPLCGDIVLCAPVVAEEARRQGKDPMAHYAHLTVHGILHLQGYDHEEDAEARIMERLEVEIVTGLGYGHPYEEVR
jgi:probable rRNA maturation factor